MIGFKLTCVSLLLTLHYVFVEAGPLNIGKSIKLMEGDIALRFGDERNANIETSYATKWPNGVIPYMIDESYSSYSKDLIKSSMDVIQTQTQSCIKFVELRKNEVGNYKTWLRFAQDSGCWSYIGAGFGEQMVSLVPGCMSQDIIVHELMHAVGFWHEQSRPDRDDYITINWQNVMSGYEGEFRSRPDAIDTLQMPYDYYSIMHYRLNTFAYDTSKPTMIAKDKTVDVSLIGTRNDLSYMDVQKVWKYYNCFNYAIAIGK